MHFYLKCPLQPGKRSMGSIPMVKLESTLCFQFPQGLAYDEKNKNFAFHINSSSGMRS